MKKKVVPKLRQEVMITSDDTKIYYTGKSQDFTARYIIIFFNLPIPYIGFLDKFHTNAFNALIHLLIKWAELIQD